MNDITIARNARLTPISELAKRRLGIDPADIEPYGHYKGKLSEKLLIKLADRPDGKLILVSGMTPTPAGVGKTTMTIGLGDALNRIGKNAMVCLREPSLGPCFGSKGGGAGGGYAQLAEMEDINLHFTGDFHAISLAHNLLAALVDNHIQQGNSLNLDLRRVTWRRVVDLNDRALRHIVVGLGGTPHGHPRQDGYDIVAASEIMAILCLSNSLGDMRERLGRIIVGHTPELEPVRAAHVKAQGAMTVLMKDAIKPNLVQTLENTPTLVHGGPFANIAHGCNSVLATRLALKLADYVVTEAGFGADLGAEKFIDIKCRKAGLKPAMAVLVATVGALKYQGGAKPADLSAEHTNALMRGLANLDRHVFNVRNHYGLPVVVALNRFSTDTERELKIVKEHLADQDVEAIVAEHFSKGSTGAVDVAEAVVERSESDTAALRFVYEDGDSLWRKLGKVAKNIYRASEVIADTAVRSKIDNYQKGGFGSYPICIAKTQYSFSTDPKLRGAPSGHVFKVRDVYLSAGAQFLVALCGDVMTMPGLPRVPAAEAMDVDEHGDIVGLR